MQEFTDEELNQHPVTSHHDNPASSHQPRRLPSLSDTTLPASSAARAAFSAAQQGRSSTGSTTITPTAAKQTATRDEARQRAACSSSNASPPPYNLAAGTISTTHCNAASPSNASEQGCAPSAAASCSTWRACTASQPSHPHPQHALPPHTVLSFDSDSASASASSTTTLQDSRTAPSTPSGKGKHNMRNARGRTGTQHVVADGPTRGDSAVVVIDLMDDGAVSMAHTSEPRNRNHQPSAAASPNSASTAITPAPVAPVSHIVSSVLCLSPVPGLAVPTTSASTGALPNSTTAAVLLASALPSLVPFATTSAADRLVTLPGPCARPILADQRRRPDSAVPDPPHPVLAPYHSRPPLALPASLPASLTNAVREPAPSSDRHADSEADSISSPRHLDSDIHSDPHGAPPTANDPPRSSASWSASQAAPSQADYLESQSSCISLNTLPSSPHSSASQRLSQPPSSAHSHSSSSQAYSQTSFPPYDPAATPDISDSQSSCVSLNTLPTHQDPLDHAAFTRYPPPQHAQRTCAAAETRALAECEAPSSPPETTLTCTVRSPHASAVRHPSAAGAGGGWNLTRASSAAEPRAEGVLDDHDVVLIGEKKGHCGASSSKRQLPHAPASPVKRSRLPHHPHGQQQRSDEAAAPNRAESPEKDTPQQPRREGAPLPQPAGPSDRLAASTSPPAFNPPSFSQQAALLLEEACRRQSDWVKRLQALSAALPACTDTAPMKSVCQDSATTLTVCHQQLRRNLERIAEMDCRHGAETGAHDPYAAGSRTDSETR